MQEVIKEHAEKQNKKALHIFHAYGIPFKLTDSGSDRIAENCVVMNTLKFTNVG